MVLNMCMFTSRVDYDAAVRRQWEMEERMAVANIQQSEPSPDKIEQGIDENQ